MTEEQILDALEDYQLDPIYDETFRKAQIENARKKFSEYYPEKGIGYISTVANQTRYKLEDEDAGDLIKVTKVYYGKDTCENVADGIINSLAQERGIPNPASTFFPSSGFEFVQRMQVLSMLVPAEAFIVSHNKFDLIPTPETSGSRVYFEYDSFRSLEDFPDIFEEDFISWVMFKISDRTFKNNQLKTSGNKYNFDRRGNISVDSETVSATEEHENNRKLILDNVKRKAMSIGG